MELLAEEREELTLEVALAVLEGRQALISEHFLDEEIERMLREEMPRHEDPETHVIDSRVVVAAVSARVREEIVRRSGGGASKEG